MHPETLGPYKIGAVLGKGGMGSVYRATHLESGDQVAVKALSPHLAMNEGFRERFLAEVDSLKTLRHAGIVRLFGHGEEAGTLFYAMELVDGPSLEEELRNGKRFTWRETTQLALQLCRALKHAHDHGVIHRDIKPANILIAPDGQAKIADFGIARMFGSGGVTIAGGVLGTADYMSPEQAAGKPVTARCDQYSLGGVMYTLLAGRPPFRAPDLTSMLQLQRFAVPEPVRRFAPDAPTELERIISQLLEKDPSKRFPNTQVLARRLEAMSRALARPASDDFELFEPGATPPAEAVDRAAAPDQDALPTIAVEDDDEMRTTDRSEPLGPISTYTPVAERSLETRAASRQVLSQASVLAVAIALIGGLAWWVSQPVSAQTRYERIAARVERGEVGASLEGDIDRFLRRHPDDPRCEQLAEWRQEIESQLLQRRLEMKSLIRRRSDAKDETEELLLRQALELAGRDPTAGAERFDLLADLFSGPSEKGDAQRLRIYADAARNEAKKLRQRLREQDEAVEGLARSRLEAARDRIDVAPAEALRLAEAVLALASERPDAAGLAAEAQAVIDAARAATESSTASTEGSVAEQGPVR